MKTPSSIYTGHEEAATRLPVELYEIWRGSDHWYYTSGDAAVEFGGHTYIPATIQREAIIGSDQLEASEMSITFAAINPAIAPYLVSAPVSLAWLKILKLFRDQDPLEAVTIFIGQIRTVAMKGAA